MYKICILLVINILLVACGNQAGEDDIYILRPSQNYLEYTVDDDTVVPLYNLYTFEEGGVEYLTFSNPLSRVILIYKLLTGELIKKIHFDAEGNNGIGRWLFGYYIEDFNNIYIPSANTACIYLSDTTGILKKKIDFSLTEDGLETNKAYYTNLDYAQLFFIGDSLYIPQMLNNRLGENMLDNSPIGILVDTVSGKVSRFPVNYPSCIPYSQIHNVIEGTMDSSQFYDGENLIVTFTKDEKVYRINTRGQVETSLVKSRYIPKLKFPKAPDDFSQLLKRTCETADYRNIFYDKYRKVYYRFVTLETELEPNENYHKILHTGKANFSIMILDEDFKVLGETRFPAFTYVPHICFINKDGLYLSTSHFKREDYSDDWLRFQRIELVKK